MVERMMEFKRHDREEEHSCEKRHETFDGQSTSFQAGVLEDKRFYDKWKRVQDVVIAAAALLVLWPLMLLIAVLIVLDSPGAGPVFSQTRTGKDGKEFTFYKFRSMKPDSEEKLHELLPYNEMDGPAFKIKDDPRITRVGSFIRKSSLDELPQLFNVLKGDMSIVGPRPALPREVEQYDERQLQRLQVLPGLTCLWQIQPHRNLMSFDDWINLDLKYIQQRSFLLDWKIIFSTVGVVLSMDGI